MLKRKIFILILTFIFIGTVFLGCTQGAQRNVESKETEERNEMVEKLMNKEEEKNQNIYQVYFIRSTDTSFVLEGETREFSQVVTPEILAGELLKGPQNEELSKTIPDETEIISVSVASNVVTLDFTKEITMGRLGSEAEMLTIHSIFQTMTQLPDVDAVQILIEGEKVETLWGHADIREPIRFAN